MKLTHIKTHLFIEKYFIRPSPLTESKHSSIKFYTTWQTLVEANSMFKCMLRTQDFTPLHGVWEDLYKRSIFGSIWWNKMATRVNLRFWLAYFKNLTSLKLGSNALKLYRIVNNNGFSKLSTFRAAQKAPGHSKLSLKPCGKTLIS